MAEELRSLAEKQRKQTQNFRKGTLKGEFYGGKQDRSFIYK